MQQFFLTRENFFQILQKKFLCDIIGLENFLLSFNQW